MTEEELQLAEEINQLSNNFEENINELFNNMFIDDYKTIETLATIIKEIKAII